MRLKHNKYWFKPKPYGYGAQPSSWEGWLVLAVYVFFVLGLSYLVSPSENIELFFVLIFLSVAVLWKISIDKSEEKWKWRWGNKKIKNKK